MKSLLRLLLKSQLKRNPASIANSGFTMVELMVAMVITFLILTPLLSFVVDMLNTDRREQVKAITEQEIQSALDFISQDLSQAVYIYDNMGVNGVSNNSNPIRDQLAASVNAPTSGQPILVFWKRQNMKNVLPVPGCSTSGNNDCQNDTYVYSLVAYYLIPGSNNEIWCQPSGGTCPSRIARYEIRDGVLNPAPATPPSNPPAVGDFVANQTPNDGFKLFDLKATVSASSILRSPQPQMNQWTLDPGRDYNNEPQSAQVLVNYVDSNTFAATDAQECQKSLNSPTFLDGTPIPEAGLRIATNTNSFYACVDSSRTIARVFIRGNSLRRLQNDAPYSNSNSPYFPTASVQVQGIGNLGL